MNRLRRAIAVVILSIASGTGAKAEAEWQLLASKEIDPSASQIEIDVSKHDAPVRAVRLEAKKGAITLSKVVVSYRGGREHVERRTISLEAGDRTRPIDPIVEDVAVERMTLYAVKPSNKRRPVVVELWGLISTPGTAQGGDDADALSTEVVRLHQAGKYAEAIPLAERVLVIREKALGPQHPDVATALNNLAILYDFQGRSGEAEPLFKRSLSIREKSLGANDPKTAESLYQLANSGALSYQSRREESLELHKRALEIREKTLGPQHPDTAESIDALARCLERARRYEEAGFLFDRLITIYQSAFGHDSAKVAYALQAKAAFDFYSLGRTSEAEALIREAIQIHERISGEQNEDTGNALGVLADFYFHRRRYQEAEVLLLKKLAIVEKKSSQGVGVSAAYVLESLGRLFGAQKRYSEAIQVYERALAIREGQEGLQHPQTLLTVSMIAQLQTETGNHQQATTLYRRLLEVEKQRSGAGSEEAAFALFNLAESLRLEGKTDEASEEESRALTSLERLHGPNHPIVADGLARLASSYIDQRRYKAADPLRRRALYIRESALGPDHSKTLASLREMASVLQLQDKFSEALPFAERVLAATRRLKGDADSEYAESLHRLASLHLILGHYRLAEGMEREALNIQERVFGPESSAIVDNLSWLGTTLGFQWRAAEAEKLLRRALGIQETAHGLADPDVAEILLPLSGALRLQGRLQEAIPLAQRALRLQLSSLGADDPVIANSRNELGLLLLLADQLNDAEPEFEGARAKFEKAYGPDDLRVLSVLNNLANLYRLQERYEEAQGILERILVVRERVQGSRHPDLASTLEELGEIYYWQNQYSKAERLYEQALTIRRETLGENHPSYAESADALAWIYYHSEKWDRALKFFSIANASLERSETNTLVKPIRTTQEALKQPGIPWRRSIVGFVKTAEKVINSSSERSDELRIATFEKSQWTLVGGTSVALSSMAARFGGGDPELAELARKLQDLKYERLSIDDQLLAAVSLPESERDSRNELSMNERAGKIEKDVDEIEQTFKSKYPTYTDLIHPAPLSIKVVQDLLFPSEVLVQFLIADEYSFAWAVTKTDSRWVRIDLGTEELARQVALLRCGLDRDGAWAMRAGRWHAKQEACAALAPDGFLERDGPPFDVAEAHELYEGLFGQVADLIKDKSLLIVPSGPLTKLPFQVLVTKPPTHAMPSGSADYGAAAWLIKSHAMTVLPSVASLEALRRHADSSRATGIFAGFGNPLLVGRNGHDRRAWSHQSCGLTPETGPIAVAERGVSSELSEFFRGDLALVEQLRNQPPLPETADELCSIARDLNAPEEDVHLGQRATEAEVKAMSRDGRLAAHRVVHFATHGLIAGESESIARASAEPALLMTPPDTATEEDDGLLTASEVSQLKLDADWVVLSACNTAAGGDRSNAEPLSGLARAFFYAGARALLVSHWYVDSRAAVKVTTGAFAQLRSDLSMGRAEALRRSMLAAMNDADRPQHWTPAAHPSVWAPFVLVGEGGPTGPR